MKRREFLTAASVAGGAAAVAAPAAAQDDETATPTGGGNGTPAGGGTGTPTGGGTGTPAGGTGTATPAGGGGGGTAEVVVGPGGDLVFEPGTEQPLYVTPGTTVRWVWDSDTHNVVVESQPEDASWPGHEPIENAGFEYTYTFEVLGEYHYYCQPHRAQGMVADLVVNESGEAPGGGEGGGGGGEGGGGGGEGGGAALDLHDLGVPFQAHFVGLATALAVLVSLIYTFFVLKYGESPNTSGGGN